MGDIISRNQVFTFFIQACYHLEKYYLVQTELHFNELIQEEEIEKSIQQERNYQNFDRLLPLLILAEQYYLNREDYTQAISYLVECQCILEEDDPNNLLKIYLFLELGYTYELMGLYNLAQDYYMKAFELVRDKNITLLMDYTFERMAHVSIVSCEQKKLLNFYKLMHTYGKGHLSNQTKLVFELISLYAKENYDLMLIKIDKYELLKEKKSFEDFGWGIEAFKAWALYHLQQEHLIRWQDFDINQLKPIEYPYFLLYWLTRQLIENHDQFQERVDRAIIHLDQSNYHYLLRSFYYILLSKRFSMGYTEWYERIQGNYVEVKERLYYEENNLRSRVQHSYHSYQQYYHNVEPVKFDKKYKIIGWEQIEVCYHYEYTKQTVLGVLMLDDCFYDDFPQHLKQQVVHRINEVLQGEITFCFHDHGVWFYFKSCTSEMKLKQRLNKLLPILHDRLKLDYSVSFCQPRFATSDFKKTAHRVYQGFYDTVIQAVSNQPYEVSFCQHVPEYYNLSKKVKTMISKAYDTNTFSLLQNNFYYRNSKELFGVEYRGQFPSTTQFAHLIDEKKGWMRDALVTEIELFTLEKACHLIKSLSEEHPVNPYLFIKLSRETLMNKLIIGRILTMLKKEGWSTNQIIISINEDVLFEENERIQKLIKRLHQLDIRIALDDYGTGTLTGSIRNLKIDYLKISSDLIEYLNGSKNRSMIIESLVNVCSRYNVKICCSGLDSDSDHSLISDLAIDVVSEGYYPRKLVV